VSQLGEVFWIIDLNRQSLDRIVPGIAIDRITAMFEASGWHTLSVRYGRWLGELFARDGGEALRRRIDEMPNEEYQRLLRSGAGELDERLPGGRGDRGGSARACGGAPSTARRSPGAWASSTTASCCAPCATSGGTTSPTCSRRSRGR